MHRCCDFVPRLAAATLVLLLTACSGGTSTGESMSPTPPPSADTTPPSAPANLAVNAVSASQTNLAWAASNDNVGVSNYRIERCQGASCTGFTQIGTTSTTSYDNAGLSASTTYRYRVRAADAAGNLSSYSTAVAATTQSAGNTPPPPPPPVGAVTSFTLSAPTDQSAAPFTVGLGFKQGDVPGTLALDTANHQVIVKSRWNDGSVKHAIASGHVALSANTPVTIAVRNAAASSSTNLTAADIQAANPQASVALGSYGTVTLTSLLATPFRTFLSGPEMVEAHYRAGVGSDPALQVWFHVRHYRGGRTWIRVAVENGTLDTANADKSYAPLVTIGGATAFDNGGGAMTHYRHTRWTTEAWIGGDPDITPRHDTAYLMNTKLVPNYWKRNPPATALNALYQNYAYGQSGGWTPSMGAAGYQNQIGLLPLWDALYVASGGDARAYRSVIANAKALNSYATVWNDSATKLAPRPSDRPTWTLFGAGAGGGEAPQVGTLHWEMAHHGSGGYLAYLITGEHYYLETMKNQAALCYLSQSSSQGSGTSRRLQGQTRAMAWCHRSVGQLAGLGGDDAVVNDYRALLQNNATYLNGLRLTSGMNELGYLYDYGANGTLPYQSPDGTYTSASPWQQHFKMQAAGHVSDLEPFADMSTWNAVRDHLYRAVVGILGPAGSAHYCYTKATSYTLKVTDNEPASLDLRTWYDSWGQVYQATHGAANNACGNTLDNADYSVATGYWANLLPAIAHAVDHGAPGAAESWARLAGAANWDSDPDVWNFNAIPTWGVAPRGPY